jgi:hypothetical protein
MPEHAESHGAGGGQTDGAVGSDEFAVSEHQFLENLNAESSDRIRARLDETNPANPATHPEFTRSATAPTMLATELQAIVRRQPLSALLGALVVGMVVGLIARR